jgi:hypothetical protein
MSKIIHILLFVKEYYNLFTITRKRTTNKKNSYIIIYVYSINAKSNLRKSIVIDDRLFLLVMMIMVLNSKIYSEINIS